jgi:hypothetical protein
MSDTDIGHLIDMYTDYEECDEYHIHDGTGKHEGRTPLPHDFDEDKLKAAIEQKQNEAIADAKQQERIKILNKLSLMDADVLAAALPVLRDVAEHVELQASKEGK